MVQVFSCRPDTAETRVQSRLSDCGICGERGGTGIGFPPNTLFTSHCHSTGVPCSFILVSPTLCDLNT